MAMPQCSYLAKGAKRRSHTTNTIKFDRIPFDQKVRPLSFRPEKFDLFTASLLDKSVVKLFASCQPGRRKAW